MDATQRDEFIRAVECLPINWMLDERGRIRCGAGERTLVSAVMESCSEFFAAEGDERLVIMAAENINGHDPAFREELLRVTVRKR